MQAVGFEFACCVRSVLANTFFGAVGIPNNVLVFFERHHNLSFKQATRGLHIPKTDTVTRIPTLDTGSVDVETRASASHSQNQGSIPLSCHTKVFINGICNCLLGAHIKNGQSEEKFELVSLWKTPALIIVVKIF